MKRTFWAVTGYTLGLGTSVYVQKRVRRAVEHYTPEQIRTDVAMRGRQAATRARDVVIDLRDAAQEGVEAMRREEDDLRSQFRDGPDPHRHRPNRLHHQAP